MLTKSGHVWHKCRRDCTGCMFCDGGLGWCTVCKAFEGQLLTHCPGYELNEETLEACYTGNVTDFATAKAYLDAGLSPKGRQDYKRKKR